MDSPAPYNYPRYHDPWKNTNLLDHICKYENLDAELSSIFYHLGIPFNGQLNIRAKTQFRSDRRPYQEVLTNSQMSRIEMIFKREIAFMGY
jgi:hypothetical protein